MTLDPPRILLAPDYPQVARIEAACRGTPWSVGDVSRVLARRQVVGRGVACGREIVGYAAIGVLPRAWHLLRLAVHPDFRDLGVGSYLLADLAAKLSGDRPDVESFVRETDLPAQTFLRAHGYWAVEVLRGWFDDTGEDAYRMTLRMDDAIEAWTESECRGSRARSS